MCKKDGEEVLSIIEKINQISKTMDNLLDFVAQNEFIERDFEKFMEVNKIEIQTQSQLTKLLMFYILECDIGAGDLNLAGKRVIDYYMESENNSDPILNSFKNNYKSVFEIKKIQKNSYETYCLTNEKNLTLIPLVKTNLLRTVGLRDFIIGRIIEFEGEFFLLEIDDVIPSNNKNSAQIEGVKFLVKNPEKIHFQHLEKLEEFKEITGIMCPSFIKCTGSKCTITTNKLADDLLEYFNKYHHNLLEDEKLESLIVRPEKFAFFDVNEYKDDSIVNDAFLDNAAGGFSNHDCVYDVGFWVDDELGIFIIPFLGTFFEIFKAKNEIERDKILNWKECVKDFIFSSKIPPSVFLEANKLCKKFENFIEIINSALEIKNDKSIAIVENFISKYKKEYLETTKFSPTIVLYNSKLFVDLINILDEDSKVEALEIEAKNVGRNEICPCGSGKKYKKCCLK